MPLHPHLNASTHTLSCAPHPPLNCTLTPSCESTLCPRPHPRWPQEACRQRGRWVCQVPTSKHTKGHSGALLRKKMVVDNTKLGSGHGRNGTGQLAKITRSQWFHNLARRSHQPELGIGIGIGEGTQVRKIVRSYEIDRDSSNLGHNPRQYLIYNIIQKFRWE